MTSKVDPCLFMSKTVICVVYVDDFLFWERSQYEIDNVMNYFKKDFPSYNWGYSKGKSLSGFLGIDIKKLDDGGLERGFVTSKVDPCLLMSKTVICGVYVDNCLFWARSQYEIDNGMNYFKEDGPSYNW